MAGRIGVRQGKVSEFTLIFPFAKGGAARLRAILQLRNGNFDLADLVGTIHDMRFVFLDNDTKLLFATAYDGDWDPYIDDFVTKIPDDMDMIFSAIEGYPGLRSPTVKDWIDNTVSMIDCGRFCPAMPTVTCTTANAEAERGALMTYGREGRPTFDFKRT